MKQPMVELPNGSWIDPSKVYAIVPFLQRTRQDGTGEVEKACFVVYFGEKFTTCVTADTDEVMLAAVRELAQKSNTFVQMLLEAKLPAAPKPLPEGLNSSSDPGAGD